MDWFLLIAALVGAQAAGLILAHAALSLTVRGLAPRSSTPGKGNPAHSLFSPLRGRPTLAYTPGSRLLTGRIHGRYPRQG